MSFPPGPLSTTTIPFYGNTFVCDEGTEENFERFGKSVATRQILCGWLDRVAIINAIGGSAGLNVANQYFYDYAVPYPDAPELLYWSGLRTEGLATGGAGLNIGPNGMVGYQLCRMWIKYSTNPCLELDQGTLSIKWAPQDLLMDNTITTWHFDTSTGPAVPAAQFPALQGNFITYQWTQFNLTSIPVATINAACAAPIDTGGLFGTAAGTLMFVAPEATRRMAVTGVEMYDTVYNLVYNPFGWNSAFMSSGVHTGDDTFHPIVNGHGNPPFALDSAGNIEALVKNLGY